MSLNDHIERVKAWLRVGKYTSEAAVCQGILLPTLNILGWPVFETTVVVPEYSLEGRRVDYALCHPANKPAIFIEVKKVGLSEGADKQLFEYAFHLGVPMAILTDGQEWSFYLPGEKGLYNERRVYKFDLLERSTEEIIKRLQRYLGYTKVCSGEALTAAREDYKSVARDRDINLTLPSAWIALLKEQDSLLLELLAEKVEELCGYKPDLDTCSQFLEPIAKSSPMQNFEKNQVKIPTQLNIHNIPPQKKQPPAKQKTSTLHRNIDQFSFEFNDKIYPAKSARDVMTSLFEILAKEDTEFLKHFSARKHGKKRRYLANNKSDLYPDRPDLVDLHSFEIIPGWWMGTNYSRRDIQKILDLALEVVAPDVRSLVKVSVI